MVSLVTGNCLSSLHEGTAGPPDIQKAVKSNINSSKIKQEKCQWQQYKNV